MGDRRFDLILAMREGPFRGPCFPKEPMLSKLEIWQEFFCTFFVTVGAGILVTLVAFVCFADKHLNGYYLTRNMNGSSQELCIYEDRDWVSDSIVLCSPDLSVVGPIYERLQQLQNGKRPVPQGEVQ